MPKTTLTHSKNHTNRPPNYSKPPLIPCHLDPSRIHSSVANLCHGRTFPMSSFCFQSPLSPAPYPGSLGCSQRTSPGPGRPGFIANPCSPLLGASGCSRCHCPIAGTWLRVLTAPGVGPSPTVQLAPARSRGQWVMSSSVLVTPSCSQRHGCGTVAPSAPAMGLGTPPSSPPPSSPTSPPAPCRPPGRWWAHRG